MSQDSKAGDTFTSGMDPRGDRCGDGSKRQLQMVWNQSLDKTRGTASIFQSQFIILHWQTMPE